MQTSAVIGFFCYFTQFEYLSHFGSDYLFDVNQIVECILSYFILNNYIRLNNVIHTINIFLLTCLPSQA